VENWTLDFPGIRVAREGGMSHFFTVCLSTLIRIRYDYIETYLKITLLGVLLLFSQETSPPCDRVVEWKN
jgi:hypothetical protein